MVVAVGLQLVYIAKFYWWETGYLRSLDIMHDRAGFYICWGCLVWVPSIYTSSTLYLVRSPESPRPPARRLLIFVARHDQHLHQLCWPTRSASASVRRTARRRYGASAPVIIVGHYTTEKGEKKESLLLASGFWGIARHFHYVPEIFGALFWTLPALFADVLPYFYVVFLTALLTDRAFRDDNRCAMKYGEDWKTYCAKVKSKILPGIV